MDNVDNIPGVFVKLNNKSTFQFCLGNSLKKESIKNYYSNHLKVEICDLPGVLLKCTEWI